MESIEKDPNPNMIVAMRYHYVFLHGISSHVRELFAAPCCGVLRGKI
jgi:hypothetical protein